MAGAARRGRSWRVLMTRLKRGVARDLTAPRRAAPAGRAGSRPRAAGPTRVALPPRAVQGEQAERGDEPAPGCRGRAVAGDAAPASTRGAELGAAGLFGFGDDRRGDRRDRDG